MNTEPFPLLQNPTIGDVAGENASVIADFQGMAPVETAAAFAGMLAVPALQANCLRLEALVHIAVAYSCGSSRPTAEFVREHFERMGNGYCGLAEDPAEDVFVSLVSTLRGNFRIFSGIREGAAFYLQRVLNVLEDLGHEEPFRSIRDSAECLLKLSNAVAARVGVTENSLGQEMPLAELPGELGDQLPAISALVGFSEEDLARLQIRKELLGDFVFPPDGRGALSRQTIGHSGLERRPIVADDGFLYLLLPTAVGSAITRLLAESVISMELKDTFESALCARYGQLFSEAPILGERPPRPIRFQRIPGGAVAALLSEVDPGRFLHLVFFVDALDGFLVDGLSGVNAHPDALSSALTWHLDSAASEATGLPSFRDGITVLVSCGFGRALRLELQGGLPENWRLESVGAHDLDTLNWLRWFEALTLWRLLDSVEAVEEQGVSLYNPNGLLNLVAWSRRLEGHLVPHGKIPDEFARTGTKKMVAIPQDALRDLRHKVATSWEPRRILGPEGRWLRVRKLDESEFEEDNLAPFYGSEEDVRHGRLRGVYVAPTRPWWVEITAPETAPRDTVYRLWMMLCVWLRRIAPILDESFGALPRVPISFCVVFDEIVVATESPVTPKGPDELRSLVKVSAAPGSPNILVNVGRGFEDGFSQAENFAERLLVESLVTGTAVANGDARDPHQLEQIIDRICSDREARWIHRFEAQFFSDYVAQQLSDAPAIIDPIDGAATRIGLGWRVRSRDQGAEITGIPECTTYLNAVVKTVLDDLCHLLSTLDRRSFLTGVILNHERAAHDRDVWKRSARANMALHDDKQAAAMTIVEHQGRLNACFLATRILIEAALCESPLHGGAMPGKIELTRAMSLASLVHHMGGWSDAIHWGAIEPRVRITPLGDVHVNHEFIDTVYEPFGRAVAVDQVKRDVDSYARLYAPLEAVPSVAGVLEKRFLDAWQAEFGVTVDSIRAFMDRLEDAGRQAAEPLLTMRRSALVEMFAEAADTSLENASAALCMLTLPPRAAWRTAGTGFVDKDWFPWRFRRRLSVTRRPFIQLDAEADPTILVAPGLVREAVVVTMHSFHSGQIPDGQANSAAMRAWIGHANDVQRSEFNTTVADRMRELGWQTEKGIRLTKILGRALGKDYGDIDVWAWRAQTGRVLAIECKDLQFNKTLGEVAEQLADFRGGYRADGRPDHLKRHLSRLDVLDAHKKEVSKALKLAAPIQIEGHLVFKNPVPMRFAKDRIARRISVSLFAELDRL